MDIKNRSRKNNPMYSKIYFLWKNMMRRCHDEKNNDYKYYGAKGIKVCDEWHSIDEFIEHIDKIKGFDEEMFLQGKLVLDKDGKELDNKTYCLEKCEFVSKEENNRRKPSQQKKFFVYKDNEFVREYFNQSEAARDIGISQSRISHCLKYKKTFKGWDFKYIKESSRDYSERK